jgi:hypothetical protein
MSEWRDADIIDFDLVRELRLVGQTLAGDLPSQARWLAKYGGEQYRQAAIDMGYHN